LIFVISISSFFAPESGGAVQKGDKKHALIPAETSFRFYYNQFSEDAQDTIAPSSKIILYAARKDYAKLSCILVHNMV